MEWTPKKYWRVARSLSDMLASQNKELSWPVCIHSQSSPPETGDGVILADYDHESSIGLIRFLGIVANSGAKASIDWVPTDLQIWVDSPSGRGFWKNKEGFAFAKTKVAGYGLHEIFSRHFDLKAREIFPLGVQAEPSVEQRAKRKRSHIPTERLVPMEIIGEPTSSTRGGYVYILESAYGYKVGRSKNMHNRMRTFGVQLPFLYTIPLCAWFDDHFEAEAAYHRHFSGKHINGEWFALNENDIELVRNRIYDV